MSQLLTQLSVDHQEAILALKTRIAELEVNARRYETIRTLVGRGRDPLTLSIEHGGYEQYIESGEELDSSIDKLTVAVAESVVRSEYDSVFNAIGDAVKVQSAGSVEISVQQFKERLESCGFTVVRKPVSGGMAS